MKYKLNLHFSVELDTSLAHGEIQSILAKLTNEARKSGVSITKASVTRKASKEKRTEVKKDGSTEILGEFTPEEVIPRVGNTSQSFAAGDKVYTVSMSSQRLFVFRDGLKCVACGIEGTKFRLELPANAKSPHFNLYAVEEGRLVMMTKDHVKPRFLGGENHHSNYQTMCIVCNGIKGCVEMPLDVIKHLREFQRENKGLPKKSFARLMQQERERLLGKGLPGKTKDKPCKPVPGLLWTTGDMNIYDITGSGCYWAYGVYSSVADSCTHVACLRRKTPVRLISQGGESVLVALPDNVEFRTWLRNLSQTG